MTLQERVNNGINWLDTVAPGWRDQVNLDELRMHLCDACICGQVFAAEGSVYEAGYGNALRRAGFASAAAPGAMTWAYEHGFCAAPGAAPGIEFYPPRSQLLGRYKRLAAAWRAAIHPRVEEPTRVYQAVERLEAKIASMSASEPVIYSQERENIAELEVVQ